MHQGPGCRAVGSQGPRVQSGHLWAAQGGLRVSPVFPHPAATTSNLGTSDWQQYPPVVLHSGPSYVINHGRASAFDFGMSKHGGKTAHSESGGGARLFPCFLQALSRSAGCGPTPPSRFLLIFSPQQGGGSAWCGLGAGAGVAGVLRLRVPEDWQAARQPSVRLGGVPTGGGSARVRVKSQTWAHIARHPRAKRWKMA